MSSESVAQPRRRQVPASAPPCDSSTGADDDDSLPSEQHAWAAQVSEHIRQDSAVDGSNFGATFRSRATVLVTLMIMQSFTGLILSSFEELVQDNVVITLFLTMLVGAGGNAGNQSTVHVIRGLATGTVNPSTQRRLLLTEAKLGLSLGVVLAVVAFFRVWLRRDDPTAALAIAIASLVIVAVSAVVGAALPLIFVRIGIDPAHAGPAVEVAMDIIGVTLTCVICSSVFSFFASST